MLKFDGWTVEQRVFTRGEDSHELWEWVASVNSLEAANVVFDFITAGQPQMACGFRIRRHFGNANWPTPEQTVREAVLSTSGAVFELMAPDEDDDRPF